MRALFLVGLLAATALAKPNPQSDDAAAAASALDDVERTANSGGSYNASPGNIDPDVLTELFGSGAGQQQGGKGSGSSGSSSSSHSGSGSGSGTGFNGDNQINVGYTPVKEENIKVDETSIHCADYKSQGFECVPYYECDEFGEMIIDGGPSIDIRGDFGNIELDVERSKCPGYLDVCCRHPDFYKPVVPNAPPTTKPPPPPPTTPTPPPTPAPYVSKCGKHNKNGIGVRIQNYGGSGGEFSTQFGEWPHMCAILEKKKGKNVYVCGGSIIDEGIIMTAAHCVE